EHHPIGPNPTQHPPNRRSSVYAAVGAFVPSSGSTVALRAVRGSWMWFEMLGSLRVIDGGVELPVPGIRQRIVLSALLTCPNRPISAGRLAELVWDGAPPAGAATTLRTYVRRLRLSLGPAGVRIVTRDPGYLIEAGESEVDALRFEALCREASAAARAGDWPVAAEACERA